MSWILIVVLGFLFASSVVALVSQRRFINELLFGLSNVSSYLKDLEQTIGDFTTHLESFNATDAFMGEPVVLDLIKHSKFVVANIKEIQNSFIYEENNQGDKRKDIEKT